MGGGERAERGDAKLRTEPAGKLIESRNCTNMMTVM